MTAKKSADDWFDKLDSWQDEVVRLRECVRASGLEEELKWGMPCYTRNGKNIVGIGAFKSYFGLWFFQGALLNDESKVLTNAQEGKTRAMRQWRMQSARAIQPALIRRYLKEAIGLCDRGYELKPAKPSRWSIPVELEDAFDADRNLRNAFERLTPGRQREFAHYVSEAKRETTRVRRTEKIVPMIQQGIGLSDRYR